MHCLFQQIPYILSLLQIHQIFYYFQICYYPHLKPLIYSIKSISSTQNLTISVQMPIYLLHVSFLSFHQNLLLNFIIFLSFHLVFHYYNSYFPYTQVQIYCFNIFYYKSHLFILLLLLSITIAHLHIFIQYSILSAQLNYYLLIFILDYFHNKYVNFDFFNVIIIAHSIQLFLSKYFSQMLQFSQSIRIKIHYLSLFPITMECIVVKIENFNQNFSNLNYYWQKQQKYLNQQYLESYFWQDLNNYQNKLQIQMYFNIDYMYEFFDYQIDVKIAGSVHPVVLYNCYQYNYLGYDYYYDCFYLLFV